MVEIVNLSKSYGNNIILDEINYSFANNGLFLVKGESGSGKTTLLDLIAGRKKADHGEVKCEGEVFYFSTDYLIENFKVSELIELHKDIFFEFNELIGSMDIDQLLDKKVCQLSKGQKQRVGIFLALSSNCPIVLLDEPLSGLDVSYKQKVIKEIRKHSKKKLVIMATHDALKGKTIFIKDGKMIGQSSNQSYDNKFYKRELKNPLKWVFILIKKQMIAKIIYLFSFISLVLASNNLKANIKEVKEDFVSTFANENIYYKSNSVMLNKESFYNNIVKQLPYEIYDYTYIFYSKENATVEVSQYYIGDQTLFSNIRLMWGLKEDEIILEINEKEFCINNNLSYCYKMQVEEILTGRILEYKVNDKIIKFKIKGIIFGETFNIYSSFKDDILDILTGIHNEYILNYCLIVYKNKEHDFYKKINYNNLLLKYSFEQIYVDEEYLYFLVLDSEREYFSFTELESKNLVACSNIGVSCGSFDFSVFSRLVYIENINVADKIEYIKLDVKLDYHEVIISKQLALLLNKKRDDMIDLRFYINDSFYVLNNVKIIDIVDSEKLVIYHNKYDYQLFYEKFNLPIRIDYVYGKNIEGYKSTKSLDYQIVEETLASIEELFSLLGIFILIVSLVSIFILMIIEMHKIKKYNSLYRFLNSNHASSKRVFDSYMIVEFLLGTVLIFDFVLFVGYLFMFVLFYFHIKKKSRINLD